MSRSRIHPDSLFDLTPTINPKPIPIVNHNFKQQNYPIFSSKGIDIPWRYISLYSLEIKILTLSIDFSDIRMNSVSNIDSIFNLTHEFRRHWTPTCFCENVRNFFLNLNIALSKRKLQTSLRNISPIIITVSVAW